MLSDEEKKAIEILKLRLENASLYVRGNNEVFYNALGIVLNLIEKQSKEIKELKNADLTTVYLNGVYDGEKKVEDKIKAKIEEVEQWELYNMKIPRLSTLDERLGAKIGIKYVLQSLLEKE